MAANFERFMASLPNDKLLALAKPFTGDATRSNLIDACMEKFANMAWIKWLDRLPTTTLQELARELTVEIGEHDNRSLLLQAIPLQTAQTTQESLSKISSQLLNLIWTDLNIKDEPDIEVLVLELFIGGLESIVGTWTIPQMHEVIKFFNVETRNMKKKDDLVFDMVKAILHDEFDHIKYEPEVKMDEDVPPTSPRSPIRPTNRSVTRSRPSYTHKGKNQVVNTEEDKENVEIQQVTEVVAALDFGSPRRSSRRVSLAQRF